MRKGKLVISQKAIVIADCDLIYFNSCDIDWSITEMFTIFIWFWHSNSVISLWHITILMKCWMNAGEVSLILCWLPWVSCYCDTRRFVKGMWSREWSLKPQIWCRTASVLLLQIMQSVLTEFQPVFLCIGRFEVIYTKIMLARAWVFSICKNVLNATKGVPA